MKKKPKWILEGQIIGYLPYAQENVPNQENLPANSTVNMCKYAIQNLRDLESNQHLHPLLPLPFLQLDRTRGVLQDHLRVLKRDSFENLGLKK